MVFSGRRGRDRLVVGFTTTCSISVYHHLSCEFEQHYVIKFVSDFLRVIRLPPSIKLTVTLLMKYYWKWR